LNEYNFLCFTESYKVLFLSILGSRVAFGAIEEISYGPLTINQWGADDAPGCVEDPLTTNQWGVDDHATRAAPYTLASQFISLGDEDYSADDNDEIDLKWAVASPTLGPASAVVQPSFCYAVDEVKGDIVGRNSRRRNSTQDFCYIERSMVDDGVLPNKDNARALLPRTPSLNDGNGTVPSVTTQPGSVLPLYPRPKFSARSPSSPVRVAVPTDAAVTHSRKTVTVRESSSFSVTLLDPSVKTLAVVTNEGQTDEEGNMVFPPGGPTGGHLGAATGSNVARKLSDKNPDGVMSGVISVNTAPLALQEDDDRSEADSSPVRRPISKSLPPAEVYDENRGSADGQSPRVVEIERRDNSKSVELNNGNNVGGVKESVTNKNIPVPRTINTRIVVGPESKGSEKPKLRGDETKLLTAGRKDGKQHFVENSVSLPAPNNQISTSKRKVESPSITEKTLTISNGERHICDEDKQHGGVLIKGGSQHCDTSGGGTVGDNEPKDGKLFHSDSSTTRQNGHSVPPLSSPKSECHSHQHEKKVVRSLKGGGDARVHTPKLSTISHRRSSSSSGVDTKELPTSVEVCKLDAEKGDASASKEKIEVIEKDSVKPTGGNDNLSGEIVTTPLSSPEHKGERLPRPPPGEAPNKSTVSSHARYEQTIYINPNKIRTANKFLF